MLNRPDYKKLVKMVEEEIKETKERGLVSISAGWFSSSFRKHDFEQSWPKVMKHLGLVDDGTGTNTYTLKGFGLKDKYGDNFANKIEKELEMKGVLKSR